MKNLYEKFRALPLTVRAAAIFLSLVVSVAVLIAPGIAIPVLLIAGTIGSFMRIFIYIVEERDR